jgi:hypothetical protein
MADVIRNQDVTDKANKADPKAAIDVDIIAVTKNYKEN